jgi:hypothetical protein
MSIAYVEGLAERVYAAAVGSIHWMERLDRQGDPQPARLFQQARETILHLCAGTVEIAAIRGQPTCDDHEAGGTKLGRIGDRAAVLLILGATPLRCVGGNGRAAAIAGNREPRVANVPGNRAHIAALDLSPPRSDGAKAVARNGIDHLTDRRLVAERRGY